MVIKSRVHCKANQHTTEQVTLLPLKINWMVMYFIPCLLNLWNDCWLHLRVYILVNIYIKLPNVLKSWSVWLERYGNTPRLLCFVYFLVLCSTFFFCLVGEENVCNLYLHVGCAICMFCSKVCNLDKYYHHCVQCIPSETLWHLYC